MRVRMRVVDVEAGHMPGNDPILVRGPGGPRAGVVAAPAPQVEVYQTQSAMSHRWLSPLPSTRRCRLWGTTTWVTWTRKTTESKGNEPLSS